MYEKDQLILWTCILLAAMALGVTGWQVHVLQGCVMDLQKENQLLCTTVLTHNAVIVDLLESQTMIMHILGGHRSPLAECPVCNKKVPRGVPNEMPRKVPGPSNPNDQVFLVL